MNNLLKSSRINSFRTNQVVVGTKKYWLPNIISVLLVALQVGLLVIYRDLPPQVPLIYSQRWGDSRLVKPEFLWLLPTICVVLVSFNFFLLRFTGRDELLEKIIFWS